MGSCRRGCRKLWCFVEHQTFRKPATNSISNACNGIFYKAAAYSSVAVALYDWVFKYWTVAYTSTPTVAYYCHATAMFVNGDVLDAVLTLFDYFSNHGQVFFANLIWDFQFSLAIDGE